MGEVPGDGLEGRDEFGWTTTSHVKDKKKQMHWRSKDITFYNGNYNTQRGTM